jgi:hypothetical protein
MALPNPNNKIISTGAFCSVYVYQNNVKKLLGLVTNASYNEDFNVTEAQVIGFFGPVSLDVQNYRCSITVGAYVPAKPRAADAEPWLDGGEITLSQLIKTRTQIALDGVGTVFDQVDFTDRQSGSLIASFTYVVISSDGAQINPATYVTTNMQMMAIEKTF